MVPVVKSPPANAADARDTGLIPGLGEDPLKKGTTTHSSILAWEISWTEQAGRLRFMGVTKSQTYN